MEQFADLDNSQNVSNSVNLKKNTTIFNNNNNNNNENNNNENNLDNEIYDIHQSKRIAEQFDISNISIGDINNNEIGNNNENNNNNTTYFQNAIQRAKIRMQKLNNFNITNENSDKRPNRIETKEKENDNEITTEKVDDDNDDDDDIIKSSKNHNIIIEEEKPTDIILETQVISNSKVNDDDDDDDDDDDEIIKPTQKHKAAINFEDEYDDNTDIGNNNKINQNKNNSNYDKFDSMVPKSNIDSLFVDDDEDDDENNLSQDELASKIENYSSMTGEQRFLARKLERSKLRNQKRDIENSYDENLLTNKKLIKLRERKPIIDQRKEERLKKQELIRQNELIKLAIKQDPVIEPTKFSKKKLLGQLKLNSDSDNDNDFENDNQNDKNSLSFINSENDHKTPPTSPQKEEKKINIQNLVKSKSTHSDKLVDLGSASDSDNLDDQSDTDFNEIDSSTNKKAKMLDLKLFFSKKKKSKSEKKQKSSLSDKIRKFNAKQLKGKIHSKSNDLNQNENNLSDDMLAKMLLDEQIKNSKSRKKTLKEEKRRKRENELLRNGQFPSHDDDDPEYSEYSSDYEISSDEDMAQNSVIEIPSKQIQEIDNEDLDENIELTNKLDDNRESNMFTQNDNFKLTQRDAFKDFNLSFTQLYDKTSTQTQNDNSKVENSLTNFEKFQKLKNEMNHQQSILETQETEDSVIEKNKLLNETSFLKNQLHKEEEYENNNKNVDKKDFTDGNQNSIQLEDILDSQNLILETQADSIAMSTQKLEAPLSLPSTQLFSENNQIVQSTQQIQGLLKNEEIKSRTIVDKEENEEEEEDDDDDEKIRIGRKHNIQDDEGEEEDDDEETEEMRIKRAEMIKLAKKKEREIRRQKEREFKAKGLGEIMENEAVESDDEYHGVGGLDKDLSDEENSEDEKLIDDASNIQIDENEMRRIQLENELKEDKEKVSKTYKDVKTHKLAERRAKDGVYAVDLSDDDDENDQLLKWREFIRKRKLKERDEFLEKNQIKIADNDPKKPFFDAMAVHLPSHISIYKDSFSNSPSELNSDYEQNNDNSRPPSKKFKSNKYKSFEDDDDIRFSSFKDQELEKLREDVLSEDDHDDDIDGTKELKRLKKKTNIKLNRKLRASQIPVPTVYKVQDDDDEFDGLESISLLSSKSNSITVSFKKSTEKKVKISANTGNIIRDVNVTTSAKTVTNSRAAVTKLASSVETTGSTTLNNKKVIKGSGLDRLDKILAKSRKIGIKKIGKTR